MQTSSQLIHHNQAIIPDPVLEALKLREGDAIVFVVIKPASICAKPRLQTRPLQKHFKAP
jgi:bifunctional DNA-binding transcriptional regulator/antitoxin component of YhaV-PrlF toxin-antitoxin module